MSRVLVTMSMCVVAVTATLVAPGIARAEITQWDAYTDFHTDHNLATDTWQYLYSAQDGGDPAAGYSQFSTYQTGAPGYPVWCNNTEYHFLGKESTDYPGVLVAHPYGPPSYVSAIGWKSPIAGTVNVSLSVESLFTPPAGSNPGSGVGYWLFKNQTSGEAPLASGAIANGGASGTITVANIPVTSGDYLFLQIGPQADNLCDLTGITFTVTTVPEPTTLTLTACGLLGLLAYVWRRRK